MQSKKLNELATKLDANSNDITTIADPLTGELKKITWSQISSFIGTSGFTLETLGTTGFATFIGTILNIPEYQGKLTLVSEGTGYPTLINDVLNIPVNASSGSVTYVGLQVPTGFSVTGSPISTSGTFNITFASGYSLPTTTSQTNWDSAYTNRITSLTTTGTSGAATLIGNVLNIPQYSGNVGTVTSVSALTLTTIGTDLTSSVANPTSTPVITLNVPSASSSNRGVLTSTDWSTFNDKQSALSGTGIVKSTTGTITYVTDNSTNWNTAYNDSIVSAAVTGTTTKTLTLTQQDAGTITATWSDISTDAVTSVFARTGAVVAQSGDYTTTQVTEGTNLYYTDGRARGSLSFVAGSGAYNSTTGVITIPTDTNQLTNTAGFITSSSLGSYLPLTGGSLTGTLTISTGEPVLIMKDNNNSGTGIGQSGYISFQDSGNVERAWIGYGSTGSLDFSMYNGRGDVVLLPSTGIAKVGSNTIYHTGNLSLSTLGGITASQTYYIGTTQNALNRASAGQTLTGVNIDGYSTQLSGYANQTIYTILTPSGVLNGPVIKVRYDSATANRYIDFGYIDGNNTYSSGLILYNNSTMTWLGNTVYHSGNLTLSTLGGQAQLNGTGFVKASGTTISYDNSTYITASSLGSYVPIAGSIDMTGSYGLNDNKLYLRTNNDNNHYLWNAADDWEELVAFSGTGFRIKSSTGTTLATFSTSGNAMNITGSAGSLSSMAISQFTNDSGYVTSSGSVAYATSSGSATNSTNSTYATYINNDSYNMKLHWSGQGGQPTWLWGSNDGIDAYVWNPSNFNVNSATHLPTLYAGGQQLNPQTYFGQGIGLRVAMTAVAGYWSDTLWINGYAGGDVLQMCALHTARTGSPRMYISAQASNATSYGTNYEFITSYNYGEYAFGAKHYPNRTDGTYYNVGWFTGDPSPAYSCNAVQIQSSTGTLKATKLQATGLDLSGYSQMYGGDFWFRGVSNDGIRTSCAKFGRMVDYDDSSYQIYTNDNGGDIFELFSNRYGLDIRFRRADTYEKSCFQFAHDGGGATIYAYQGDGLTYGMRLCTWGDSLFAQNVVPYYGFSDERLKQNIATIENPIEKIMQLRGVTYEWNEGYRKDEKDYGLIAQEVQKVLPELVKETDRLNSESKYLNVNYEHIVGLLVEGIKEQQKQIDYLKTKINI